MSDNYKTTKNKQTSNYFLDTIAENILKKFSEKDSKKIIKFLRLLLSNISLRDLKNFKTDDLLGMILSFWKLIAQKKPKENSIRVYNPSLQIHGWESKYTVIEIITNDKPFLVDSVLMEIDRNHFVQNLVIHYGGLKVKRSKGVITGILSHSEKSSQDYVEEAPIHIQINRQSDPEVLEALENRIREILKDVEIIVNDWHAMRSKMNTIVESLAPLRTILSQENFDSTCAFVKWVEENHFTFLGYREFLFNQEKTALIPIAGEGLGILRGRDTAIHTRELNGLPQQAIDRMLSKEILIITKTNTPSTVHRPVYTDRMWIKIFDPQGEVKGIYEVIGLYTAAAYNTNPNLIPFISDKVKQIMALADIKLDSYAGKALSNIIETLPTEDLFQGTVQEILQIAIGILQIQERREIRLFSRFDLFGKFVSCLVFIPREKFNTELRMAFQNKLEEVFDSKESIFFTRFSDSVLIRTHFLIRTNSEKAMDVNFEELEQEIAQIACSWDDELKAACLEVFGEEDGYNQFYQYRYAFSHAYQETISARNSVYDIRLLNQLNENNLLELNFYQRIDSPANRYMFKIYQMGQSIPLSEVIPILENMGLKVIDEQSYQIKFSQNKNAYINDFTLEITKVVPINLSEVRQHFQEAFSKVWFGEMENDSFNRLILLAKLNWREVSVIRAYSRYLRQTGFTFSQSYMEATFASYSEIAANLVQLFHLRFSPDKEKKSLQRVEKILTILEKQIDSVSALDDDRILRRVLEVILATVRTNYYQTINGEVKPYITLKFESDKIQDLPLPKPKFEFFVYSPCFEGIHLRGSRVARGGLRWSDRKEDFRTEILGLMKAQNVKNAVIVPSGAKGGFVTKCVTTNMSREAILRQGVSCYQNFIRGLLDLVDNIKDEKVIHPPNCVAYDQDDPYLVVAADKGTATFSDFANNISQEYDYWLKDAFASGGSAGYDHKKMGITARGAWESVKRHFRELGVDTQSQTFTVVGIGDMSGDVFGNGLLLSKHLQLVAALNHQHIFLDPNPDPMQSYEERLRLFQLERSTWEDYDRKLISKGGGIYARYAKTIKITPEVKERFDIPQDYISPNELIVYLLKSPVDLLWNGGIGTFVKSSNEKNTEIGDRANDAIRINATDLRAKVVAEGGNLGLTQLGRIEYALNGGKIYSDFIDNSAGVDCSDHEVNIKILLNDIINKGDLTIKQRNALLVEMTDEVAEIVLNHNYRQTQAISIAAHQASRNLELHSRFIRALEKNGSLNRNLEFLPNDKVLHERKLAGKGLTPPGIAVLLAYSKIQIKNAILASSIPEDPYMSQFLYKAFPKKMCKLYEDEIKQHSLRREIIATQISNIMVNEMGFSFVFRLFDETGAPVVAIVRAYLVIRDLFQLESSWKQIESLDNRVASSVQYDMHLKYIRLIRRSTRWILKNYRLQINIDETLKEFKEKFIELKNILFQNLCNQEQYEFNLITQQFINKGVERNIAEELGLVPAMMSSFDIMLAWKQLSYPISKVAKVYFIISQILDITWLRQQIIEQVVDTNWDALTREGLRDDIDWQQRLLTISVLDFYRQYETIPEDLKEWTEKYAVLIQRWQTILSELRSLSNIDFTMFYVAIRELLDLTQTCSQRDLIHHDL